MSDDSDGKGGASAYRHRTVYRTVRGVVLSGGREGAASERGGTAMGPPLRASEKYQVRRGAGLVNPDPALDDASGVFDAARYSEPND